jgi:hypothetical protein
MYKTDLQKNEHRYRKIDLEGERRMSWDINSDKNLIGQ